MTYILGDVYIGNYPETQGFGDNPQNYAQFGLKGHDGIDIGAPTNTQVIASNDGWIKEVGSDPTGYGNYVKVIHNGYLTLSAHLDHATVSVGDKVIRGQLIGYSDNTGNSTGAHIHFGVAPCDSNGAKTEINNGYAGYIDPNGNRCSWDIKNPTQPVSVPSQPTTDLQSQLDQCRTDRDKNWRLYQADEATIANLNQQINDRNNDITQLNAQIKTLQTQLEASNQQVITLQPIASKVPDLTANLAQCEQDRQSILDAQSKQNVLIGNLKSQLANVKPKTFWAKLQFLFS